MLTKHCSHCAQTKPVSDFTTVKAKTAFKNVSGKLHTYCRECNAQRAREWRKDKPNYRGSGKLKSIPNVDRGLMSAIRSRLVDARSRAAKYGKECSVTAEELYQLFLDQGRKCALTGLELLLEKKHPMCLSLDQIDPTKGYVPGNVQWLGWAVNRAKGDLATDDFLDMCSAVLDWKVQRLSP